LASKVPFLRLYRGVAARTATLTEAIAAAHRAGDLRIAATARTQLARIRYAAGDVETARTLLTESAAWYRSAGGGDGSLLTRALLAGLTDESLLPALLEDARRESDPETEVVVLDALARIAAERGDRATADAHLQAAERALSAIRHLVDEADRVDAHRARALLS